MKFQDNISNMNTHTHTDNPKPICPPLFQSWGHNNFFGIKLLHAHLQYVCNTPAKYQINILKALGVDFTKYALSPIRQYVQWSKTG